MRLFVGWVLVAGLTVGSGAQKLDEAQRKLARDVFQELIETNTSHSVGSTTAAAEKMRDRLLKAGFSAGDMEIVGPSDRLMNLVVRWHGKDPKQKPVLVIGHLDVVEARREDWTMDPFVLNETGGYFYGRGTQDMKDSDAAYVTSFLLLKQAGYVPRRDLILALTADEEGGGNNGVEWLMKNRRDLVDAAFAINPDMGGPSLRGGKPVEMAIEETEKLYADFEFKAVNAGGHSSRPTPDNAIYAVADALGKLERTPFPAELNAVTRGFFEAQQKVTRPEFAALMTRVLATPMDVAAADELSAKSVAYNAKLRTTCVATMMSAGHALNALPGSATANVNCRILPGHSAEEVRQRLVAVVNDPRVTVRYRNTDGTMSDVASKRSSMAAQTPGDEVMKPLRAVTEAMWPGIPIVPTMSAGASDSIHTAAGGIPSFGFTGMGIEEGDDRAHGRDERIRVDAFYAGVEFTKRFVEAVGKE